MVEALDNWNGIGKKQLHGAAEWKSPADGRHSDDSNRLFTEFFFEFFLLLFFLISFSLSLPLATMALDYWIMYPMFIRRFSFFFK